MKTITQNIKINSIAFVILNIFALSPNISTANSNINQKALTNEIPNNDATLTKPTDKDSLKNKDILNKKEDIESDVPLQTEEMEEQDSLEEDQITDV